MKIEHGRTSQDSPTGKTGNGWKNMFYAIRNKRGFKRNIRVRFPYYGKKVWGIQVGGGAYQSFWRIVFNP